MAADCGVKIALEMHLGYLVYSPETMLKLRAITGSTVGATSTQSLFWQGTDPIAAIRILGDAIHYVHAKDTEIGGVSAASCQRGTSKCAMVGVSDRPGESVGAMSRKVIAAKHCHPAP